MTTKDEKYAIYLYSSPITFPLSFALHHWFVAVSPEGTHRYEIWHKKGLKRGISADHLYKDFFWKANQGLKKGYSSASFDSTLVWFCSGNETSLAHDIGEFLEKSLKDYPFKEKYHFVPGPNCNTYVEWVLLSFPEISISLSSRAFGKKYAKNYFSKKK
ncbi:DUF3750 domain-containing protein [Candidatus Woesearchaeota archaeon]|nr:DUF3750 domain-containing protein [Nanoarchaeota archaeon]MCB9370123.1 DUF3750 domain-containing protein [Candidatus Woesearchaeota archaeon]USN44653.1 MAG: DUF3750 domain-containing protein [Candidatus Woesearchaeota archaeon]